MATPPDYNCIKAIQQCECVGQSYPNPAFFLSLHFTPPSLPTLLLSNLSNLPIFLLTLLDLKT